MSCNPYHIPRQEVFNTFSILKKEFPIHAAIYNKDMPTLRKLCSIQTNDILFNKTFTPIMEGVTLSEVSRLIEYRNSTPLEFAIFCRSIDSINVLAEYMFVDFDRPSTILRAEGKTPLQFAITDIAEEKIAIALIKTERLNLEKKSIKDGCRAVHYAAAQGHTKTLFFLSHYEAELTARINDIGLNALQSAVYNSKIETAIAILGLPEIKITEEPEEEDLLFSVVQAAFEKDDELLLKAILDNNPDLKNYKQRNLVTKKIHSYSLQAFCTAFDSLKCFQVLKEKSFSFKIIKDNLKQFPQTSPEMVSLIEAEKENQEDKQNVI